MALFGTWLGDTAELQKNAYGFDPSTEKDFERWITYVREQTLAAFVELGEFIQCLQWKPWRKKLSEPEPLYAEREDAIEEIVDVLHFISNLLLALGVSDAELNRKYEYKMEVNRNRMARGGH